MAPPTFPTQRDVEAKSRGTVPQGGGGQVAWGKLAEKMHLFGKHVAFTGVFHLFAMTPVFKAHSRRECAVFPWIVDSYDRDYEQVEVPPPPEQLPCCAVLYHYPYFPEELGVHVTSPGHPGTE